MAQADFKIFTDDKPFISTVTTNVECPTDISCEVKDVIGINVFVTEKPCECLSEEISFGGRVIFNVIYMSDGEIRRKEIGAEFSDKTAVGGVIAEDKASVSFSVEGVTCEKTDRLTLYATVKSDLTVFRKRETKYLENGDGYVLNKESVRVATEIGKCRQSFTLDDKFESVLLSDVLSSSAQAIVTACQCGVGSVIVDGEIILTLSLLPLDEKSDILKENRVIPFRLELECSSASVEDVSGASVTLARTKIKVVVDEAKNKSTIISETDVVLSATAYRGSDLNFVEDLFSVEKSLSVAKERVETEYFKGMEHKTEKQLGKCYAQVPENARLVTDCDERVYAVSFTQHGNSVEMTGICSCYALFKDNDSGKVIGRLCEMPVSAHMETDGMVSKVNCVAERVNLALRSGELEMEAEIAFTCYLTQKAEFCAVTELEEGEDREVGDNAFSIYVSANGDKLWDVCKALKVTPETVTSQNPNATFPTAEGQKILIYKRA